MKQPPSRQPSARVPATLSQLGAAPVPLPRRKAVRAVPSGPAGKSSTAVEAHKSAAPRPVKPAGPEVDQAGSAVKRRVRLTTESRDELVERLKNPQVNLDEAAILLRVCRTTVRRYADSGLLPHVRTEGGQRRFYFKDIEVFYLQYILKK